MISNDDNENKSISVYFCFKQLEIKCEFLNDQLKFYYLNENDFLQYIGCVKSEEDHLKSMTILKDKANDCFIFLLLLNENSVLSEKSCFNCGFYIKNSLFKVLFEDTVLNNNSKLSPNLLIATYDGFLYKLATDNTTKNPENNANILLTTLSSIIYLDVFMIKDEINSLFEPKKDKNKRAKIYNSIFLITSNGEIFVYYYLNTYKFAIQSLTHTDIRTCIRFKDDLFYCTNENEIYSFNLNNLTDESMIEVKFWKKIKVFKFYIENFKLYAKTFGGRLIEISESIKDNDINQHLNIDNSKEVKILMNKFHSLSNKIIESQCDLDKIDKTLNQMQILKRHEINEDSDEKNLELFEVTLKLKSIDSQRFFEINLKNKNLILEDNFSKNSFESYSTFILLVKIKFKSNFTANYIWLHKKSLFTALKPAQSQIFLVDVDNMIEDCYKPTQITIYLLYNIKKSKINFEEDYLDNREFKVCLYNSKIDLNNNFFKKGVETVDIESFDAFNVIEYENSIVEKPWRQINLNNIDKNQFDNCLFNQIIKNQSKKIEIYYDLFDRVVYRVDLIDKNLFNLSLEVQNDSNLMNLIRFKNEFIIKVIFILIRNRSFNNLK